MPTLAHSSASAWVSPRTPCFAAVYDVVWVFGYGWPRATGGPMRWADGLELDVLEAGLDRFRDRWGADFRVAASIRQKVREGGRFFA
jgi:3-hydroxyacyl-CoA dehydrogenase